jgi:hypothetical protein
VKPSSRGRLIIFWACCENLFGRPYLLDVIRLHSDWVLMAAAA